MVHRIYEEDSMRVGVFGISRSGKDYTIEDFIALADKEGCLFTHLSPMAIIRERLDGRKLSLMDIDEKRELVRSVRRDIDKKAEDGNIVVDEHYCYPSTFNGVAVNNGYYDEKLPHDILSRPGLRTEYEVVLPRFEALKYDVVACMRIDPKIITERTYNSEGAKKNMLMTPEIADEWQRQEIRGAMMESDVSRVGVIDDPGRSGEQLWDFVRGRLY